MIKKINRFIKISLTTPKSFIAFTFEKIFILFYLKIKIIYPHNKFLIKKIRVKEGKYIGHASETREIIFYFFGIKIFSFILKEGLEATSHQFFYKRSLNDLKFILSLSSDVVKINIHDQILDPGCGTGKHLFYLIDNFNCSAVGVDIHKSAIDIANITTLPLDKIKFYNHSSLDLFFLDKLLINHSNIIFINSWINHVMDFPNFDKALRLLVQKSRYLFVINSNKYNVKSMLYFSKLIKSEVKDGTFYGIFKGNLD